MEGEERRNRGGEGVLATIAYDPKHASKFIVSIPDKRMHMLTT